MSIRTDVIVIGGGIAGVSAAARIARDSKVVLLERESALGYHSTGRSAAIFIRNYGNATLRALNGASAPILQMPEGISDQSLLSPRGEMLIASGEEIPALNDYIQGAVGIDIITPKEALELVPILRIENIESAAIEHDALDIDVDRLLQGFARLLRSLGGVTEYSAEVQSISKKEGNWLVETPRGTYEAPIVVNAAGAWVDQIALMAGVAPIGILPMRRSAAILPAPAGYDVTNWPLVASATKQWYAKPEAGKLMVSPADEDIVEPHDAWPDDMILAEGLDRFEQATTVPVTRVERSWAGLRCFVPDRTPVVGFDADMEGFFWLAGQGGYGVQTSPALAQLTADLIAQRKSVLNPEIITALKPDRLKENR